MKPTVKEKGYSNFLSFLFSGIFLVLIALGAYIIVKTHGTEALLRNISLWEFTIIALASYRLTRLFVYDKIFQFFRDLFLDKEIQMKDGRMNIIYSKPKYHPLGLRRLFADLLGCPWCTGVWVSLFVVFAFYITPYSWAFLIVLAIAGVSAFFQITMNLIGWSAEKKKLECEKLEN